MTLSQLQREVPQINWREYLTTFMTIPLAEDEPIVSYALPYHKEMAKILRQTDRRYVLYMGQGTNGFFDWLFTK